MVGLHQGRDDIGANIDVFAENSWPFRQTLHLVLLLLLILFMAQVCLCESLRLKSLCIRLQHL